MSDDEAIDIRLRIRPDPTTAELVAILTSLQQAEQPSDELSPTQSRWVQIARREQLRAMLDDSWSGWK